MQPIKKSTKPLKPDWSGVFWASPRKNSDKRNSPGSVFSVQKDAKTRQESVSTCEMHTKVLKSPCWTISNPLQVQFFFVAEATQKAFQLSQKKKEEKKKPKLSPQTQRDKARSKKRFRVNKSKYAELIEEYEREGEESFAQNHPEIKNPQQRVSNWRKSLNQ